MNLDPRHWLRSGHRNLPQPVAISDSYNGPATLSSSGRSVQIACQLVRTASTEEPDRADGWGGVFTTPDASISVESISDLVYKPSVTIALGDGRSGEAIISMVDDTSGKLLGELMGTSDWPA